MFASRSAPLATITWSASRGDPRRHRSTIGEQLAWLRTSPVYAGGEDQVSVGDVTASGLVDAVRELAGGTSAGAVAIALEHACTGPGLADLVDQIANLVETAAGGPPAGPEAPESAAAGR